VVNLVSRVCRLIISFPVLIHLISPHRLGSKEGDLANHRHLHIHTLHSHVDQKRGGVPDSSRIPSCVFTAMDTPVDRMFTSSVNRFRYGKLVQLDLQIYRL
jgi:hypothetical protein